MSRLLKPQSAAKVSRIPCKIAGIVPSQNATQNATEFSFWALRGRREKPQRAERAVALKGVSGAAEPVSNRVLGGLQPRV